RRDESGDADFPQDTRAHCTGCKPVPREQVTRMLKRWMILLALVAWLAVPATRGLAQHETTAREITKSAKEAGAAAQRTAEGAGEAMGEGEHKAELLPNPTSRETMLD